jgi:hypothetical protein
MRLNLTSERFAGGLGLIGLGAFAVAPTALAPFLPWVFIIAGIAVLLSGVRLENGHVKVAPIATFPKRVRGMWPQLLMLVCATGFVVGLIAYLQRSASTSPTSSEIAQVPPEVSVTPRILIPETESTVSPVTPPAPVQDFRRETAARQEPNVSAITPFHALQPQVLRARVGKFAEGLRSFERDYQNKVDAIAQMPNAADRSQEVRGLLTKAQTDEILDFQKNYLPDARDLVNEMLTRLQLPRPRKGVDGLSSDGQTAFDSGLVYRSALANLADYMDELATKVR